MRIGWVICSMENEETYDADKEKGKASSFRDVNPCLRVLSRMIFGRPFLAIYLSLRPSIYRTK